MALQPITSTKNATGHNGAHGVQSIPVVLNGRTLEANRRMALNLDWVDQVRVNTSAVERRAATLVARRTVKKDNQAAWLLRAIACMDLTTLSGDDSVERVRRLCAKARNPLQRHIVEGLGIAGSAPDRGRGVRVSRVCGDGGEGAGGIGHSGGRGFCRVPGRAESAGRTRGGDSPLGGSGRAGDRHCHHARACFQRRVAGALRRGCGVQGGVRARRAHEGHSGHRRSDDAAQRGAGQLGGDDGRGGLYQDFDGQGKRERDAAGFAGDGAVRSATMPSGRAWRWDSSRRAAFARRSRRRTGWP